MSLLLFKLILPPFLILVASLVGRRWGDAIGGWLVGLPLTSGPVAAFLAIQHGPEFAALATSGSLIGTAAQACFGLAYALLAQRGWVAALIGGSVAYAIAGLLFQAMPLPHWGYFALALATLSLSARYVPHHDTLRSTIAPPWWDLPARMVVVTTLVVTLTAVASLVGAKVAGILASFPVFGIILTVFAHRVRGPVMATQVLRGMVFALYGFATFFFVLGVSLVPLGVLPGILVATVASLVVQGVALGLIRRGHSVGTG
ncbi:MAG: hypothetical protein WD270_05810 [Acetobacterales bacterium]